MIQQILYLRTRLGWSIHTSDLALDYIILFVFADVEALMLQ